MKFIAPKRAQVETQTVTRHPPKGEVKGEIKWSSGKETKQNQREPGKPWVLGEMAPIRNNVIDVARRSWKKPAWPAS